MKMERMPVSSSNIAEIGYDEPSGTLAGCGRKGFVAM